jgi:hypothetical protein
MGRRILILSGLFLLPWVLAPRAWETEPCDQRPFPRDGRRGAWCTEGPGWLVSIGPAFERINLAEVFSLMDQLRIPSSCGKIQQRMFQTQEEGWTWFRAKIFADDFFRGDLGLVLPGDTLWCAEWWVARSPAECQIQDVRGGFYPDEVWKPARARGAVASWIGFCYKVPIREVSGIVVRGGTEEAGGQGW